MFHMAPTCFKFDDLGYTTKKRVEINRKRRDVKGTDRNVDVTNKLGVLINNPCDAIHLTTRDC